MATARRHRQRSWVFSTVGLLVLLDAARTLAFLLWPSLCVPGLWLGMIAAVCRALLQPDSEPWLGLAFMAIELALASELLLAWGLFKLAARERHRAVVVG